MSLASIEQLLPPAPGLSAFRLREKIHVKAVDIPWNLRGKIHVKALSNWYVEAIYQIYLKIGYSPYVFKSWIKLKPCWSMFAWKSVPRLYLTIMKLKSTTRSRSPEITRMYLTPEHLNVEACKAPSWSIWKSKHFHVDFHGFMVAHFMVSPDC